MFERICINSFEKTNKQDSTKTPCQNAKSKPSPSSSSPSARWHTFTCRTKVASAAGSPGRAANRSAAANTTGGGCLCCCSLDVANDEVSGSGGEADDEDADEDADEEEGERRDAVDRGCNATRKPRDCDCESNAEPEPADERKGGKSDEEEDEDEDGKAEKAGSLRFCGGGGGGASDERTARDALNTAGGLCATDPLAVGDVAAPAAAAVGLALAATGADEAGAG